MFSLTYKRTLLKWSLFVPFCKYPTRPHITGRSWLILMEKLSCCENLRNYHEQTVVISLKCSCQIWFTLNRHIINHYPVNITEISQYSWRWKLKFVKPRRTAIKKSRCLFDCTTRPNHNCRVRRTARRSLDRVECLCFYYHIQISFPQYKIPS